MSEAKFTKHCPKCNSSKFLTRAECLGYKCGSCGNLFESPLLIEVEKKETKIADAHKIHIQSRVGKCIHWMQTAHLGGYHLGECFHTEEYKKSLNNTCSGTRTDCNSYELTKNKGEK